MKKSLTLIISFSCATSSCFAAVNDSTLEFIVSPTVDQAGQTTGFVADIANASGKVLALSIPKDRSQAFTVSVYDEGGAEVTSSSVKAIPRVDPVSQSDRPYAIYQIPANSRLSFAIPMPAIQWGTKKTLSGSFKVSTSIQACLIEAVPVQATTGREGEYAKPAVTVAQSLLKISKSTN